MMLKLDHIAVLGPTLTEAADHVETALGQPMQPGGVHARFGTHNQLLGLDPGLYLEAIAIDPSAEAPSGARWFGLDQFTGPARLDKWICRVADMDRALAALPMAGAPVRLQRGDLCWTMAVPPDGMLPFDGMFPALIQWHSDVPPGDMLDGMGRRLDQLIVAHPRADALAALLAPHLDAPLVRFESAPNPSLQARIRYGDTDVIL